LRVQDARNDNEIKGATPILYRHLEDGMLAVLYVREAAAAFTGMPDRVGGNVYSDDFPAGKMSRDKPVSAPDIQNPSVLSARNGV